MASAIAKRQRTGHMEGSIKRFKTNQVCGTIKTFELFYFPLLVTHSHASVRLWFLWMSPHNTLLHDRRRSIIIIAPRCGQISFFCLFPTPDRT